MTCLSVYILKCSNRNKKKELSLSSLLEKVYPVSSSGSKENLLLWARSKFLISLSVHVNAKCFREHTTLMAADLQWPLFQKPEKVAGLHF